MNGKPEKSTLSRDNESAERTVEAPINIGEAFLAIMKEVGYVQKAGELKINGKLQYKFAGERQLIEALRPALLKYNVICIPSEATSRETVVVAEDGRKTFRTIVDYTFVYTHVPSQTHIQVAVVGEGVDTGDKSAYKAATGALKYALRQPFLIETGDEPEVHEIEEPKKNQGPTDGIKTAREEYGTAVKFKEEFNKIAGWIEQATEPEHFAKLQPFIQRMANVDSQCAENLEKLIEERQERLAIYEA